MWHTFRTIPAAARNQPLSSPADVRTQFTVETQRSQRRLHCFYALINTEIEYRRAIFRHHNTGVWTNIGWGGSQWESGVLSFETVIASSAPKIGFKNSSSIQPRRRLTNGPFLPRKQQVFQRFPSAT